VEDPVLCGIISQKNAGLTETEYVYVCASHWWYYCW